MTQSSLQTQCPQCETRFRVTDEQLSIAGGKVRCGNCMHVFNAVAHKVLPETGSAPASSGPETTPTDSQSSSPEQGAEDDDLVFEDNPEEDATEGRYAGNALTFSQDELSDSFRDFDQTDTPPQRDDKLTENDQDHDESWAEAMLHDDDDDKPAEQHPEQPSEVPQTPEPSKHKPEPEPATPADELSLSAVDDDRVLPTTQKQTQPGQQQARREKHDDLFQDLRHEPVSVDSSGGGLRKALWSLVILTLLGVLVAQVVWFQFDRLAAIPQLRPFYEQACELAGCKLKPLINVEAIQSRKLVVRTNPDNRNQLIVDAVIVNQAGFEQPFPAIALTFSNLNGDVVAQSTFTPEEYLADASPEQHTMPRETPVRIAINIRDPGRDAVNYELSFRPWNG